MKSVQRICGAAAVACAMSVTEAPAESQRAGAVHLAAVTKTDTAIGHKTIRPIKSTPPRKKSRCYG